MTAVRLGDIPALGSLLLRLPVTPLKVDDRFAITTTSCCTRLSWFGFPFFPFALLAFLFFLSALCFLVLLLFLLHLATTSTNEPPLRVFLVLSSQL